MFHDADAWRMCASPLNDRRIDARRDLAGCSVGERPDPDAGKPAGAGRGAGPAAARGQGRAATLALGAGAASRDLADYRGRFGVMSFDPRLRGLLKTNMPEVPRGLVVRDRSAAASPPLWRIALADPAIPRGRPRALGKSWVDAVRGADARSTAGRSARRSNARKPRFMPTPSSGKPMADRESEVLAKIASGVAGLNARAWDRARRRRSVRQPCVPLRARGFGQRRAGHRLDARADPDRGRRSHLRRRRARLSQDPQPGRICVRPWLGRGVGAGRRAILSQAPDRGAVHAGAGAAAARAPPAAAACRRSRRSRCRTTCRRRTSPSSTRPAPPNASGAAG